MLRRYFRYFALVLAVMAAVFGQNLAQSEPHKHDPNEMDAELNEQIVRVPITVTLTSGEVLQRSFVLSVFKPNGTGPFPTVIVSHGRPSIAAKDFGRARLLRGYFVHRGFAVLVPTRIGYGVSGADYDVEQSIKPSSDCDTWTYEPVVKNVLVHIQASLAYAKSQPWFDKNRIVLAGHSAGGFGSLVAAGELGPEVKAVISFSGGMGGYERRPGQPCNPQDVEARLAAAAQQRAIPTLWFYGQNDRFWGEAIPKRWHAAYLAAGGKAEFHTLVSTKPQSHELIAEDRSLWQPKADQFLTRLGFQPRKPPKGTPAPSRFAKLENVAAVPLVDDKGREGYKAFLEMEIPRAFAIRADGFWAATGGSLTAIENTLQRCQKQELTPCKLYAVNDEVVWQP